MQVNAIFKDLAIITKDQGMMLGSFGPTEWTAAVCRRRARGLEALTSRGRLVHAQLCCPLAFAC
jgi:hypothetical protein